MKQRSKKLLSILLSLVMVLGLLPGMSLTALADGDADETVIIAENASLDGANTSRNLAVGRDGVIHIVYRSGDSIFYRKSTNSGSTFSEPVTVATGNECEVAVSSTGRVFVAYVNNSNLYIAYSDNGTSFTSVQLGEVKSYSLHIAVDGSHVYAIPQNGTVFFYSSNGGQSYESHTGWADYMYSDVHVDESNHNVVILKDEPNVVCRYSSDYGATFSDERPVNCGENQIQVYFSTAAVGNGYAYMAGNNAGFDSSTDYLYKIDYINATATGTLISACDLGAQNGRSLSADHNGNVVVGYVSNGKACYQVSLDGGDTVGSGVEFADASAANAAINTKTGDVLFLYESDGKIMLHKEAGVVPGDSIVYNGKLQDLLDSRFEPVCQEEGARYVLGTNDQTAPSEGWGDAIPQGKDAGFYYVWVQSNTTESTCKIVEIVKANALKTKPKGVDAIYHDGAAHALAVAGEAASGKIVYALGESDTQPAETAYSETIPTAAEKGDYTVWYKVVEFDAQNYYADEPQSVKSNIDDYHTLTYAPGAGTGEPYTVMVKDGASTTIPKNKFTAPDEKFFTGWSDGSAVYPAGASYTPTGNATLTAQWTDGYLIPDHETNTVDLTGKATGYSFAVFDYYGPSENFGSGWDGTLTITLPEDKALYIAGTVELTRYGSDSFSISGPSGVLKSFTVPGSVDMGTTESSVSLQLITNGYGESAPGVSLTVIVVDKATLSFDADEGTGSMADQDVAVGAPFTLPACTLTAPAGKVFTGWSDGNKVYGAGASYTPTDSVTLTAQWTLGTTISYELTDSCGDSWNGAAIKVTDKETGNVIATLTVESGSGASGTLDIPAGRTVVFTWVSGGYDYECSYTVKDAEDNVIFSGGDAMSEPKEYRYGTAILTYTVTFKVVNGSWNEGEGEAATADKTVTLTGYEGDTLKLAADQIPTVGTKPNDTYKAGSWDVEPSTEAAITEATTYTYTYAAKEASVVTKAPEAKTLTYTGSAQELVTAGEATGGEMQYALGDANGATQPYTTSIPTATDAGTYYVWYKVVGDENHNDTEAAKVTVTISKATVTAPTIASKTYTGEALTADVAASTLYSVTTNNGGTNVGSYDVVLTLTDSANYKWTDSTEAAKTLSFNITKATAPTVTVPTPSAVTYDPAKTLADISLPDGWAWVTGTTVPTVGNEGYAAALTVDDANYNYTNVDGYDASSHKVTRTVSLTVNKAEVTAPTIASKTYTGEAQTATVTASTLYSVTTNNGGTNVGSYNVVLTLTDSANYKWTDSDEATKTLTFAITQATANTVTVAPEGWTYGETAKTPTYTASFGVPTYTYSSEENGTYTSAVPDTVGTWYVKATVAATNDYVGGTSDPASFTIAPKEVTVSGITASKTYDGTTDATLIVANASIAGLVNSDAVTVSSATGSFSSANAGSSVALTIAAEDVTLSGDKAGNYSVTSAAGTGAIETKPVTIKATDQSIVLNGSIATGVGQVSVTSGELISGHSITSVTLTPSSAAAVTTSGTITPSAVVIQDSGSNDVTANYSITPSDGVLTVTIATPAVDTAASAGAITYGQTLANSTISGSMKDQNTNAAVPGTFTWDAPTTEPAVSDSNTTAYAYTFTPTDSVQYSDVHGTLTVTVNPKPVTLSWTNTAFTYDGASHVPTATVTDLVGDDVCTVTVDGAQTDANAKTNTENYTATATSLSSANYTLTGGVNTTQTFTIAQKSITGATVTLGSTSFAFDGSTQSVSVTGVQLADETVLGTGDYSVSGDSGTNAASYTLTVTGTDNYTGTATADWTITPIAITGATVILAEYAYGSTPSAPSIGDETGVDGANGAVVQGDATKTVTYYYQATAFLQSQTDAMKAYYTGDSETLELGEGVLTELTSNTFDAGKHYVLAVVTGDNYSNVPFVTQSVFTVNPSEDVRTAPTAPEVSGKTATVDSADRDKTLEYSLDGTTWLPVTLNENGAFDVVWPEAVADAALQLREAANANYANPSAAVSGGSVTTTTYTVTYNANGGKTAPAAVTKTTGESVTVSGQSSMTRTGYTFAGWNEAADGSGTAHAAGSTVGGGMTLYAQWTANTYTVRFNANGGTGTMADQSFTYDDVSPAALTANEFTRDGYSYLGWSTTGNGAVKYQDQQTVKNLADSGTVTLYAVWAEATKLYTITGSVISGAAGQIDLTLKQGNVIFVDNQAVPYTTANTPVGFTLTNIPEGTYNLIATQGNLTMTIAVVVSSDISVGTLTMPSGQTNSILEIEGSDTPAIVVGGLEQEAAAEAVAERSVTVTMTVETKEEKDTAAPTEQATQDAIAAIKEVASGAVELEYMDITVKKEIKKEGVSESTEKITETSTVFEIIVPFNFTGRRSVAVFRHHDNAAAALTPLSARPSASFTDGSFWLDMANSRIYIYSNRFSTYAISYTETGSDTGSSGSGTSATTITATVTGDANTVPVTSTISGTTATVKALTDEQLGKVIGSKLGDKDTGASAKTEPVVIDVSGLGKDIATATIPTATVKAIAEAAADSKKTTDGLTVKLTDGSLTFDAAALAAIVEQAKGSDIKFNFDNIGDNKLNTKQKATTKEMDVQAVYDAYITSNGVRISDFKGGKVTVTVTYTLKADQKGGGVVVWYVADDGDKTEIPTSYDAKEVTFNVNHFSNYVVAYDAERAANSVLNCAKDSTCPISAFTDAKATAWYHDGVHWALESGVMNGVGDGKFAPNDTTTRAQVVTMLWRMEGKPASESEKLFTDVDSGSWYGPAIRWASAVGVVKGVSDSKFAPNDAVTREQLVTILYRYAKYKKMDVSAGEDTNILSYDDAFDVSEWAIPAMQWACGSGIVNGLEKNGVLVLAPFDSSTRAVVATMFWRFSK